MEQSSKILKNGIRKRPIPNQGLSDYNNGATERRFSPYSDNGGSVVAIAGEDFCVIASDTRLSQFLNWFVSSCKMYLSQIAKCICCYHWEGFMCYFLWHQVVWARLRYPLKRAAKAVQAFRDDSSRLHWMLVWHPHLLQGLHLSTLGGTLKAENLEKYIIGCWN